ncbi:MAG: DUF3006 domain-containing protein [bacterium]|nr:DUF3006 domain-containing protein [bacterium]
MRFVIDRFEGDIAVLVNDVTINIPKSILPEYAKEGDIVIIELRIDREETEKLKREIKNKIDRLIEREEKGDVWL